MTETATPEALVARLTAALDEAERRALGTSTESRSETEARTVLPWLNEVAPPRPRDEMALRAVAAHREIVDRYAETLRDYARTKERARGGPVGNADLDDFEAELPVLRSIVEIIAGIYEEPPT